jgi:hypothetical protein
MDKAFTPGLTVGDMKDNGETTHSTEKAFTSGPTTGGTRETGKTA